mmetsp:Transcript_73098/g.128802  ORF Transcript_73098/g.128802 Transcript_73098/m.128802 type:complete len:261 (+) Transcript_73098:133-915(+)
MRLDVSRSVSSSDNTTASSSRCGESGPSEPPGPRLVGGSMAARQAPAPLCAWGCWWTVRSCIGTRAAGAVALASGASAAALGMEGLTPPGDGTAAVTDTSAALSEALRVTSTEWVDSCKRASASPADVSWSRSCELSASSGWGAPVPMSPTSSGVGAGVRVAGAVARAMTGGTGDSRSSEGGSTGLRFFWRLSVESSRVRSRLRAHELEADRRRGVEEALRAERGVSALSDVQDRAEREPVVPEGAVASLPPWLVRRGWF